MIELTRLSSKAFYLNSDLIESIEETPDTVITMTNGKKFIVAETAAVIIERIIRFRSLCLQERLDACMSGTEETL